jgi:hypothetical protein
VGDGITDAVQNLRSLGKNHAYHYALVDYLEHPDKMTEANLFQRVKEGYGPNFSDNLRKELPLFLAKDEGAWAKLFWRILNHEAGNLTLIERFKNISPFRGKFLLLVDYNAGGSDQSGEFDMLAAACIKAHNMRTHDCDKYLLVLERDPFEGAAVHWVSHFEYKGPRPVKG